MNEHYTALGIDGGSMSASLWVKVLAQPTGSSGANSYYLYQQGNNTSSKTEYLIHYYDDSGTKK